MTARPGKTGEQPLGRAATVAVVLMVLLVGPLLVRSGLGLLIVPPYAAVGVVVGSRRPHNPIGWLLIAIGFGFAILLLPSIHATVAAFEAGTVAPPEAALAIADGGMVGMAMFTGLFVLTVLFPSGTWPPGRAGHVARVAATLAAVASVVVEFGPRLSVPLDGSDQQVTVRNPISIVPDAPVWRVVNPDVLTLPIVALIVIGTISLVVRLRRARGVERQQLQWVVAAIAFMVAAILFGLVVADLMPAASGVAWIPALAGYVMVPVAIGTAVLRYRLFEIDRIVSRTISWALTSGAIAVLFVGLVVGLQAVLSPVTRESTVAVAGSTLIAFVAFQPMRRRVQSGVDHRFNRSRYDAERTVGALAAGLRNGVDLDAIRGSITQTVDRTFRPSRTDLWVREETHGVP